MGYICPKFENPSDFFMKLMNEEGLLVEKQLKGEDLDYVDEKIQKEFE